MNSGERTVGSAGETFCEVLTGGFAIWTLLVHGAVIAGANLYQLIFVAGLCLLVFGVYGLRRKRQSSYSSRLGEDGLSLSSGAGPTAGASSKQIGNPSLWKTLLEMSLGLIVFGVFVWTQSWVVFWWTGTGLLLLCLGLNPGSTVQNERPMERRSWNRTVLLFALLCVLATLFAHRPDRDDALYIGQAVGAADDPAAPILAQDNLHGIAGLPLSLPVYKLESLGVGVAAVAFATPLAAIDVAHFVVPTLAALLLPLVYARLFRQLYPRYWVWTVAIALVFLWCAGDTHRSFGNFAFVRLFQGKAIFLSVAVPWILASAMAFGREPNRKRWWRLAASQVAAVGLTSTALLIAPAVAGLGLLASVPWRRGFVRRVGLGVAASVYLLGLAPWIWLEMPTPGGGARPSVVLASRPAPQPGSSFVRGAEEVLGADWAANAAVLAMVGAAIACRFGVRRRFALVIPLGFLLMLWNPYLEGWLQGVLGPRAYWRIFWALPLPVLVALLLAAPLALSSKTAPRFLTSGARKGFVVLATLLLLVVPGVPTWSLDNGVRWGWPHRKVPTEEFSAAMAIVEHASPKTAVLAPTEVSAWIVTLHDHPDSLFVRRGYLRSIREGLGQPEVKKRLILVRWTERRMRGRDAEVSVAIDDYALSAICLRIEVSQDPKLHAFLGSKGFELVEELTEYAVWARQIPG